ncbi:hypothetical protein ACFP56_14265 [Paenibacillus septentrionalis]|uniref:Uncharacterized protein n=1 Tax=Paenibacillus septentrionalis TaxID=429342 RepID=A0ABW1V8K6_9BACL
MNFSKCYNRYIFCLGISGLVLQSLDRIEFVAIHPWLKRTNFLLVQNPEKNFEKLSVFIKIRGDFSLSEKKMRKTLDNAG